MRWVGAFATCGGRGAIQSSTIVYEIEPAGTPMPPKRPVISLPVPANLWMEDGKHLVGRQCVRPSRERVSRPRERGCGYVARRYLYSRRDVHPDVQRGNAASQYACPWHAKSPRVIKAGWRHCEQSETEFREDGCENKVISACSERAI